MEQRKTYKNNYYHLYSRGVDKRVLFLDHSDYLRFMATINLCNNGFDSPSKILNKNNLEFYSKYKKTKKELVCINNFTLMPNHFHIESKETRTGNIGKLKQRVLNSYTKYFNQKYKRTGHIFESRYKIKRIENDIQLDILRKYIYRNPLKILDKTYKHIDVLNGNRELSKREKIFLKKYPYKYITTSDVADPQHRRLK